MNLGGATACVRLAAILVSTVLIASNLPLTSLAVFTGTTGNQIYFLPQGMAQGTSGSFSGLGLKMCPAIPGADQSGCSTNWSGYAITTPAGGVDEAFSSWVVPQVTCHSLADTYSAVWVGIDGFSSGTVEQTGVLAGCFGGVPTYLAWYEFYPDSAVMIPSVSVSPGDIVTARVSYDAGSQEFTTYISSSGGGSSSFSQAVPDATRSSAEWIMERPAICTGPNSCSLATLADFGTAFLGPAYTGSNVSNTVREGNTTGPFGSFPDVAISMVNGQGTVLAQPSSLSPDGASFSVAYTVPPLPPPPTPPPAPVPVTASCNRQSVNVGIRITCRARVIGTLPSGTVTWSTSGQGSFSVPSCRLSRGACQVRYTPTLSLPSENITASYGGDAKNPPGSGNFSLAVNHRPSKTTVFCSPAIGSVARGTIFKCIAFVKGYLAGGAPSWSQRGLGAIAFGSTSCTLASGKCYVMLNATKLGGVAVVASYPGDANNLASSGARVLVIRK